MDDSKLWKEVSKLDDKIWKHHKGHLAEKCPVGPISLEWLRTDITEVLLETSNIEESLKEIKEMISSSDCGETILKKVDFDKCKREAEIRCDWSKALRTEDVHQLASAVRYALSKRDIAELALLHKRNRQRKKIEDFLESVNFHYECGRFANKEYAEFLEGKEESQTA